MTSSDSRARKFTRGLRAGVVWENCSQPLYPDTPFGGVKQSGFGREYGEMGLVRGGGVGGGWGGRGGRAGPFVLTSTCDRTATATRASGHSHGFPHQEEYVQHKTSIRAKTGHSWGWYV